MIFDPQFWIVQILILFVFGLLRSLPDLFLWQLRRQTRRMAEDMTSDEADRFREERDTVVREAPGRWLELIVTYSFLRRTRRQQQDTRDRGPGGGAAADGASTAPAMPSRAADKAARAGKKAARTPRRPRTPLSSRLTTAFTSFGGSVIGGAEGADYTRAWKAELGEVSNPVIKVAHALSNVIGAIAIRVTAKTMPRARRILAAPARMIPQVRRVLTAPTRIMPRARHFLAGPARICSALLDAVASSELFAYLLVGAPVLGALIVAGYALGKMPLAFTTAVGGIPPVGWAVDLLHQYLRKQRRPGESHGE